MESIRIATFEDCLPLNPLHAAVVIIAAVHSALLLRVVKIQTKLVSVILIGGSTICTAIDAVTTLLRGREGGRERQGGVRRVARKVCVARNLVLKRQQQVFTYAFGFHKTLFFLLLGSVIFSYSTVILNLCFSYYTLPYFCCL